MTRHPENQTLTPAEGAPACESNQRISVSTELIAAYRAASYWVELPHGRITLRIGEHFIAPPDLGGHGRLAVVTAFNPFSSALERPENEARQAALVGAVDAAGLTRFQAAGVDPLGAWEPEPSLGILDPSSEQLDEWMERFEQNAVVVADPGEPVVLRFHPRSQAS